MAEFWSQIRAKTLQDRIEKLKDPEKSLFRILVEQYKEDLRLPPQQLDISTERETLKLRKSFSRISASPIPSGCLDSSLSSINEKSMTNRNDSNRVVIRKSSCIDADSVLKESPTVQKRNEGISLCRDSPFNASNTEKTEHNIISSNPLKRKIPSSQSEKLPPKISAESVFSVLFPKKKNKN